MKILIYSDPHFTDREQDAYRWEVFPFLHKVAELEGPIDVTACLGDLTEFKDHHSSELLHRIKHEIQNSPGDTKIVLKGNHDYIEEGEPFFDWLQELTSDGGGDVIYCSTPRYYNPHSSDGITGKINQVLCLPHTRNPHEEWKPYMNTKAQLVLAHVTVSGSQSEMGQVLPGIARTEMPGNKSMIISGDIHKPQSLGPDFMYVGTPYSTRFSPPYQPRVLVVELGEDQKQFCIKSISTGLKRKVVFRMKVEDGSSIAHSLDQLVVLDPTDELRVVVEIGQFTLSSEWKEMKEMIEQELKKRSSVPEHFSVIPSIQHVQEATPEVADRQLTRTPEEALHAYCKAQALPEHLATFGSDYLREHSS